MNRRDFSRTLVEGIGSYALLRTLAVCEAFGRPVRPITDEWRRRLHEMSRDLKTGGLTPRQWQAQIQVLFDRLPLRDLLEQIDFDRLAAGFDYADVGVRTQNVLFPRLDGLPENLAFFSKIFGLRKDRAIIPHGHRNMASCHYVLKGALHLRHYDKHAEDETHMVIEPTVDTLALPGSHSSISDAHYNIHWLRATTDVAFTFDVLVLDIGGRRWHVDNIDPYGGEQIAGGLLRVRKLSVEDALARYGHEPHH